MPTQTCLHKHAYTHIYAHVHTCLHTCLLTHVTVCTDMCLDLCLDMRSGIYTEGGGSIFGNFRGMPTANAEGWIESEGSIGKGADVLYKHNTNRWSLD